MLSPLQLAALFLMVWQRAEIPGWAVCLLLLCQLLFFTELAQRKGGEKIRRAGWMFYECLSGTQDRYDRNRSQSPLKRSADCFCGRDSGKVRRRERYSFPVGKVDMLTLYPLDLYREYLVIGGMPQAVKTYAETKDFNFVLASPKTLNDAYIADMAKYATAQETTRIMAAWNSVPAQLAKENHKFQYKVISRGRGPMNMSSR